MQSTSARFAMVIGALALAACASAVRPANQVWTLVPDLAPDSAILVRGNAAAAGALSNDDQTEIVARVFREFYHPPDRQARWMDPRPLAHVRTKAADDTVGADPDFADEVVAESHSSRICVLASRDFGCRGKTGGVVRFSWPYRFSKDSAMVFAIYTPRDSLGVSGEPQIEMQFKLRRSNDDYWEMFAKGPITGSTRPNTGQRPNSVP